MTTQPLASEDLHCEETGAGPPAVLLHSSGMSGRQWRRLATELVQAGRRAIVPDLTGHGRSSPWPAPVPFSFRTDVERLLALLAQTQEPVDLIGHSYGGFLALMVASAAPSRVRSLALYDPVAFGTLDPTSDAEAIRSLEQVPSSWDDSEAGREGWLQSFVDYWGGPGAWTALRNEARDEFRRVGWVLYQGVATLSADKTPASAYRVVEAPVLLLSGEKTPIAARRVAERLHASMDRAHLVTIAQAGHMGPLTHADLVNRTILAWLASGFRPQTAT